MNVHRRERVISVVAIERVQADVRKAPNYEAVMSPERRALYEQLTRARDALEHVTDLCRAEELLRDVLARCRTLRKLERGARAAALRSKGATLREVGDEMGVSTARARQLLSSFERAARKGVYPPAITQHSPIDQLNLPGRTRDILYNAGIGTLSKLVGMTERQLLRVKKLGPARLAEVDAALGRLGLARRDTM